MNTEDTEKLVWLLKHNNTIPKEGVFEITEEMINKSLECYKIVKPPKQRNSNISKSNNRFIRKMAAITLLKESMSRANNKIKPKSGILYLISNPAFIGFYKVGITQDLDKRLAAYQTYDPLRRYKVEHYKFVPDMRLEEKRLLQQFHLDLAKGEWIASSKAKKVFSTTL